MRRRKSYSECALFDRKHAGEHPCALRALAQRRGSERATGRSAQGRGSRWHGRYVGRDLAPAPPRILPFRPVPKGSRSANAINRLVLARGYRAQQPRRRHRRRDGASFREVRLFYEIALVNHHQIECARALLLRNSTTSRASTLRAIGREKRSLFSLTHLRRSRTDRRFRILARRAITFPIALAYFSHAFHVPTRLSLGAESLFIR